jgi:hypothetical protein
VWLIAALTREHGVWPQACLRTCDERSRVQCLVPARGARRGKVLDEVSAAIPRDAVARNVEISRAGFASAGARGYDVPNKLKKRDLTNIATTTLAARAIANKKNFFSPSLSSGLNVIR